MADLQAPEGWAVVGHLPPLLAFPPLPRDPAGGGQRDGALSGAKRARPPAEGAGLRGDAVGPRSETVRETGTRTVMGAGSPVTVASLGCSHVRSSEWMSLELPQAPRGWCARTRAAPGAHVQGDAHAAGGACSQSGTQRRVAPTVILI